MNTAILGKNTRNVLSRSLIWLPLILLFMVIGARAQDQSSQEKIIMGNVSANTRPPLDLQAPAVTETASFALG
jgi:hypothetical protein